MKFILTLLLFSIFAFAADSAPMINLSISGVTEPAQFVKTINIAVILTLMALAPTLLLMVTSFTRIIIVFSLLRQAMGLQQTPPTQIVVSLSLILTIFIMAKLFGLGHTEYVTLLPKSITTAIGMGVSEELGGYVTITVAVIVITGVIGNIFAELICKIFRINEPIAKGIAIGSASHAIGTAKAMEMGEIEGAMSSLSIAVAGILTVFGATLFSNFM